MKKLFLLAGTLLLTISAWAGVPDFSDLGLELSASELDQIDGEALLLAVDRTAQTLTVTTFNKSQVLGAAAPTVSSYSVPVVTAVVRNQDVSTGLKKNAMTNTAKTEPAVGGASGNKYNPTQFPTGTAKVGGTQDLPGFGTAIKTNATQVLPYTTTLGSFTDAGYYIHYTAFANTNGCVGVPSQSNMQTLLNTYNSNGGDRYITVSSY